MGTPPKIEVAPLRLKRALFIDADPEIREMLRDILDPRRWSVRHAANNLAAFELVKQTGFDLIITSDKTSGRDDVELLRKIRIVRAHTRVIILADQSAPSYVIDSMRERAFSYFSRPFSLTSLAETAVADRITAIVRDSGVEPEVVEYLKTGWTVPQLKRLLAAMGKTPRDVLRVRGTPADAGWCAWRMWTGCERSLDRRIAFSPRSTRSRSIA